MVCVGASVSVGNRDMLFLIMEQCKSMEKENRFVQDVMCAPEPMAVLCSDQQLCNILLL